jgi:hypothetical protein
LATQQEAPQKANGPRGNKKGKRGRAPTMDTTYNIVIFHLDKIVGESSQKLKIKLEKEFQSRHGFYLVISKLTKNAFTKRQKLEKVSERPNILLLFWKKKKVFNKSSPLSEYFCCC